MSELYQLPDGWEWKKLSDVCDSMQGIQLPKVEQICELREGYVRYLYISDFTTDKNIIYVVDQYKNKIVNEHEYVIVNTGATAGKIFHGKRGVLSNNLFKVSNFKKINDRYFYFYYLVLYQNIISNELKQSTQPHLGHKAFNGYDIPLPPIPEQKRIVQKLDVLFERVDKAIALLQKNIADADNFMNSVFNDVFSDLEQNYEPVELTKYVNFIGGSQPPKSEFSDKEREGYVRLIQIRDYKSDNNIVYVKKTSVRRFCNKDDVMIGRYGPPVFQILRGLDGAYNVALMKAEPNEEFICKDFLFLFLKNPSIQNYIIGLSQRSAGQSGVNKEALEKYLIALPAMNKQKEIVLYLNQVSAQIEQVKLAQKQKMQNLLSLKSSILDQAFHGKL